jgi:hypothetical protein
VAAIPTLSTLPPTGVQPTKGVRQHRAGHSPSKFDEVLSKQTLERPAQTSNPSNGLVQNVLTRVDQGRDRLDQIIEEARQGKKSYSPRELMAIQAEVYCISEELSLVNKVVEEGMSGVKRLWNLQV